MNAHENPFRSSEIAKLRYQLGAEFLTRLAKRATAESEIYSVVGLKGTGKTTLLEDLEPYLQARGRTTIWVRLNTGSTNAERHQAVDSLDSAAPGQIILLDGGEVLTAWDWLCLRRKLRTHAVGFIATLHRERSWLPVLYSTKPDWDVAQSLIRTLAGPELSRKLQPIARQCFQANNGNVREVFRACYWACARQ